MSNRSLRKRRRSEARLHGNQPKQPPARYQEWLTYLFDRPATPREWFWEIDEPDFEATNEELVTLITETMLRCGTDLAEYNPRQIDDGLNYIFSENCGKVAFSLLDQAVPLEARIEALQSMRHLYLDCFETRAEPVLGHRREEGNELNYICYMLWDVFPSRFPSGTREERLLREAVLGMMESVLLESRNPACQEGVLHGLGHMQKLSTATGDVTPIIRRFLDRRTDLRSGIVRYAEQAATGCVL